MDNTLIIYYSDHGLMWKIDRRIPLIFVFPDRAHVGRIQKTTQLIDIAPTVLDYLGVPIPNWMEGQSLLRPQEISKTRPIFTLKEGSYNNEPPLYGLISLTLNICHQWLNVHLPSKQVDWGTILNHSLVCPDDDFPKKGEWLNLMLEHLRERGFKVSQDKAHFKLNPQEPKNFGAESNQGIKNTDKDRATALNFPAMFMSPVEHIVWMSAFSPSILATSTVSDRHKRDQRTCECFVKRAFYYEVS